ELAMLRWLRGRDAAQLTPYLAKAYLPASLAWLGRTRVAPLAVLGARFAFSVRSIGRQDMPRVRGLQYLACVALIAGISAIDAAGAIADGRRQKRADAQALSYHSDQDGFAKRPAA